MATDGDADRSAGVKVELSWLSGTILKLKEKHQNS
jgi:hypothetical protein